MKFRKCPWVIFIVKAEVVAVVEDPKKDDRTLHVDEAESKQILKVYLKWTIIFFCNQLENLEAGKASYLWLPFLSLPFLNFFCICARTD